MSGCKVCDKDSGDGDGDGDVNEGGGTVAERAVVGFQADVAGAPILSGSKCNSCGCTKCCGKCVLKTAGKITYCANE